MKAVRLLEAVMNIAQVEKADYIILQRHGAGACAGKCEDMSVTYSFWQLADMHMCFMRVPTLLKVWQLPSACWSPRVGAAARMLRKRRTVLWLLGTGVTNPGSIAGQGAISISRGLPAGGAVRNPVC